MAAPITLTFVYDGGCSVCTAFARYAAAHQRGPATLTCVPNARMRAALPGEDLDAYAVTVEEQAGGTPVIYRAELAIARVCTQLPGPLPALGALARRPRLRPVAAVIYRWVARNRSAIGRALARTARGSATRAT